MSVALDIPAAAARFRIPLSRLFAVATVAVFVALPSPWPATGAAAPIVDKACSLLGFALVTTATLGRLWSLAFISGHKNTSLVQDGPYSCTRNPLYFFSAIGALGIGIASRNVAVLALAALFFLVYYPAVVRHEEDVLSQLHGEAFTEYKRRVPRFLPRLSLYREPDEYTVRIPVYRRTFLDAIAFLWGYLAVELMVWLRASGYVAWPTWNPFTSGSSNPFT
jgi:protein-S-isoprenylcysteine O-methyltransferase Ste14